MLFSALLSAFTIGALAVGLEIHQEVQNKDGLRTITFKVPDHGERSTKETIFSERPSYTATIEHNGDIQPISIDCRRGPACDCRLRYNDGGIYNGAMLSRSSFSKLSPMNCANYNNKLHDTARAHFVPNMRMAKEADDETDGHCLVKVSVTYLMQAARASEDDTFIGHFICKSVPSIDRVVSPDKLPSPKESVYIVPTSGGPGPDPKSPHYKKTLFELETSRDFKVHAYCLPNCECTVIYPLLTFLDMARCPGSVTTSSLAHYCRLHFTNEFSACTSLGPARRESGRDSFSR